MPLTNRGLLEITNGNVDWDGATDLRVLLLDDGATATPTRDTNFVSDIVADEVSTTNYARQATASRTQTENDTSDRVIFNMATTTFAALGPSSGGPVVAWAVIFRHTGSDATAVVLAYIPILPAGTPSPGFQVNGSDFVIDWSDTNGVFYIDSPS